MFLAGSLSELVATLEYQLGIHSKPIIRQPSKEVKIEKAAWILILAKPNADQMIPYGMHGN